jgi:carboxypeptidase Taq
MPIPARWPVSLSIAPFLSNTKEGHNVMGEQFEHLKQRLHDIANVHAALSLLEWDQQTHMPPGGAAARAEQSATLSRLEHDLFVSDGTGELLQAAADEVKDYPTDSEEFNLVRVTQRDYDQQRKIPPALITEMARHGSAAYHAWVQARASNDFGAFAPFLEKTVDLSRQVAGHLGYEDQLYDALLDQFEPGMKTAHVQAMFTEVREQLVPLVRAIAEQGQPIDDSFMHGTFDAARQAELSTLTATAVGYDFSRGRIDTTAHPFEISFSRNDVRITTNYVPDYFPAAFFSTLHESGHGMYEQGIGENLEGTLLCAGTSLGVHESQSRLWENVVGRSRLFWQHFYPRVQRIFPDQFGAIDSEQFYRAINRVEPSLIRIDADEVTYNLHIMLRLEMELALLSGDLSVADAPAAWNDKMDAYLGLRPPTNALGILQDVHWSQGMMGYFSTYSLGNFLSVQFYEAAVRAHPEIPDEIGRGQFDTLRGWLTENIYRYGRTFDPNDLVIRATGEPMQSRSYMAYLQTKFGELYGLTGFSPLRENVPTA